MRGDKRKIREILQRVAIFVVALLAALYGRYGDQIIIKEAELMAFMFAIGYTISALFLTQRHYNPFGDHLLTAVVVLSAAYGSVISIIFLNRSYYSLGFIATFVILSFIGTLVVEQWKAKEFSRRQFRLVSFGNEGALRNDPRINSFLYAPEDLNRADPEDLVVIPLTKELSSEWRSAIADFASRGGDIVDSERFIETQTGRISIDKDGLDLISVQQSVNRYAPLKRLLDLSISSLALVVLLIPMLIVGILISLTSAGFPIFFQRRIGLRGMEFTIFKFRTMVDKVSDQDLAEDDRITRMGYFLRRWRIDEWPQFFNVLKGEMSLVGPRPEQAHLVELYAEQIPYFNLRHRVRPGITGWAQIHHGHTSTIQAAHKKTEYDLYYLKYFSFVLDLTIMVQTVIVLITGRGSK